MKNKLFFIIFCLFLFIPTVNGTNLTNVITTNDGLGNICIPEEVRFVVLTLVATEKLIIDISPEINLEG